MTFLRRQNGNIVTVYLSLEVGNSCFAMPERLVIPSLVYELFLYTHIHDTNIPFQFWINHSCCFCCCCIKCEAILFLLSWLIWPTTHHILNRKFQLGLVMCSILLFSHQSHCPLIRFFRIYFGGAIRTFHWLTDWPTTNQSDKNYLPILAACPREGDWRYKNHSHSDTPKPIVGYLISIRNRLEFNQWTPFAFEEKKKNHTVNNINRLLCANGWNWSVSRTHSI